MISSVTEQQEVPTRAGSDVTGAAAGGQAVRGRGHSGTHLSGEKREESNMKEPFTPGKRRRRRNSPDFLQTKARRQL